VDLDLSIGIPDNYNAILRDFNVYGDNRDAAYFKTEDFQLTSDDDFVIVYGINHERTGKAIYSNASFYGAELFNGVAGAFSTVQFPDTAAQYFPKGYENAGYYYVYKMAMVGPYIFDIKKEKILSILKRNKKLQQSSRDSTAISNCCWVGFLLRLEKIYTLSEPRKPLAL